VFRNGWTRTFAGGTVGYRRFHEPVVVDYPETPDYFAAEVRRPQEMNFLDLLDYTRELRDSGQPVQELEVSLHNKIAFPATAVIMALVALPFAFRLGKQGALYGLGISVLLGMLYLGLLVLPHAEEASALPPMRRSGRPLCCSVFVPATSSSACAPNPTIMCPLPSC
jgi:hypothetical protein